MAKKLSKAAKPKAKKNVKVSAKPAARKSTPKPAVKKAAKPAVAAKKSIKKVTTPTTKSPALKESTNGKLSKNLPPMQITANDSDVIANAKVRYSAKDLETFRKVIMEQRAEASEEFDIISQQLMDTSGEFDGENQSFALHTAEQGSDAMEREKHFLQAQRTSDYIKKLDEALERIQRGTYGICVICGNLIEKERLYAVPITQKHVNCKNNTQKKTFSASSSEAAYIPPEEVVD
jgi:RNA polymerase-binding transcription factor DksA